MAEILGPTLEQLDNWGTIDALDGFGSLEDLDNLNLFEAASSVSASVSTTSENQVTFVFYGASATTITVAGVAIPVRQVSGAVDTSVAVVGDAEIVKDAASSTVIVVAEAP